MQKYELLLILPGTLDEKEVETRAEEIVTLVKEQSDRVELQVMGKNRLAYPIKQIRYGYYYTITFTSSAEKVTILQNKLSLLRDVLRAVVTHFKTNLSDQQKIAYSPDANNGSVLAEKDAMAPTPVAPVAPVALPKAAPAPVATAVETPAKPKKEDKLDMEQINKKLDDIMSGDVIPGV